MLEKLTLTRKILWGFTLMIALILLVGVVGYSSLSSSSTALRDFTRKSENSGLIGKIYEEILSSRIIVRDYLSTQDESNVQRFEKTLGDVEKMIAMSRENIVNRDRLRKMDEIEANVSLYSTAWSEMVLLMRKRFEISENILDKVGPEIESALTSVMESSERDGNARGAFLAGSAVRHLLLARLNVVKFLENNNKVHVDRVRDEFGEFGRDILELKKEIRDRDRQEALEEVMAGYDTYMTGFLTVVEAIEDRNVLITGTLDRLGPVFASDAQELRSRYQDELADMGAEKIRRNSILIWFMLATMGLAVLAGIFLSRGITRSVVEPLNDMA